MSSCLSIKQFMPKQWDQEGISGAGVIQWSATVPKKITTDGSSPWFFEHFVVSYPDHYTEKIPLVEGQDDEKYDLILFSTVLLDKISDVQLDESILVGKQ